MKKSEKLIKKLERLFSGGIGNEKQIRKLLEENCEMEEKGIGISYLKYRHSNKIITVDFDRWEYWVE